MEDQSKTNDTAPNGAPAAPPKRAIVYAVTDQSGRVITYATDASGQQVFIQPPADPAPGDSLPQAGEKKN